MADTCGSQGERQNRVMSDGALADSRRQGDATLSIVARKNESEPSGTVNRAAQSLQSKLSVSGFAVRSRLLGLTLCAC